MEDCNIQVAANNFLNVEANKKASEFVTQLCDGSFSVEVLPNNYVNFTGTEEFKDYKNYCTFLKSMAGVVFMNALRED
ncbi:hypothetical protein EZS27_007406 [termite gut metagenome]|uniref:Uncharacterized protein n=1 Tax=termite gut metagenome TaxID=433724 RepID=A0A5J4SI30_9ZZZZ